jgi:hypothetical protein
MNEKNLGKQFDEIMGRNISSQEESSMQGKATAEHLFESVGKVLGFPTDEGEIRASRHATALSRMRKFPSSMVSEGADGDPQVSVQHKGWTHTWSGGPYIEHSHPTMGPVDVTNMHDYSKKDEEQGYANGSFTPTKFMQRVKEFHKDSAADWDKM